MSEMKKILIFIFCSLSLAAPTQTSQSHIRDNISDYTSFLQGQTTTPYDYIKGKFRDYDVVALGEDHWVSDHMKFLSSFLQEAESDTTFHIDALAWESGNIIDQGKADTLMAAPSFREELALQILRDAADTYGWPYREAVDALKALWHYAKVQKKRTRLLLLDPPYMLQALDGEKYHFTLSRDQSMANRITGYIQSGRKVLFYAGSAHTQNQFHAVFLQRYGRYAVQATAGKILKTLYPRKVFSIKLWGGLMGSNGYMPSNDSFRWQRCGDGKADEAFERNGNKPLGFDIADSPFADMKVNDYFHFSYTEQMLSTTNGSPFREAETLKDRIDGIIFLHSVSKFTIPHIEPSVFNDAFIRRIGKRTGGSVKSLADVYALIQEKHPTLAPEIERLKTLPKQ
ncbi:hypothetical protein SAMN05216383_11815 [Prevotella sp. KH2C16]|nr:hypothetical protein SAMN05216383_11815 [Prevotella sp. KH2C16]